MRNLKKIIAVVVTLVMLFAITSISASAATAPVFSLYGKTETNLTVAAGDGENQEFYELTVYLEDTENQVGAIQGVITYDPAIFTYQAEASELGAALDDDDGYNTVENSLALDEAGTIKFVGVANEAGTWFILRFTVDNIGPASFGLVAEAANATGTAHLDVTAKSLENATVTDEAMINMEGGAILQKTVGLSNPKNVLTGENYTGALKGMDAKELTPKAAIADMTVWNKGLLEGLEFTNSGEENAEVNVIYNATALVYTGGTELLYYVDVPEGESVQIKLMVNFEEYITVGGETQKYAFYGHNYGSYFYILGEGEDQWRTAKANGYYLQLEEGFKGILRIPYKNLGYNGPGATAGFTPSANAAPYEIRIYFNNVTPGTTVLSSYPWIVAEYSDEYDPYVVNVSEPTQDLAFNVTVDSDAVATAEATYGEVTEIGTLLMYTKRLGNRELKIDMADKTGLVHASKAVAAEDAVESFVTNLNNIKWNGMGVSVSARAYIKFTDGTVIYSKNFNNVYETNSGYARESVIGVAVDAVNADEYDAAKAAALGYNVDAIKAIVGQTAISGQDRIDLLNFIADCYKAN